MSFWVAGAVVGSAVIGAVSSRSAAKTAAKGAERGQDILQQSREQARQDVLGLFPEIQQAQQQGFQQSRDFLSGQVLPQQLGAFQQGNVAAQEQLARGLPQVQSAILGLPTDLSGFQARQQQLPQFALPEPPQPTQPTPTPPIQRGFTTLGPNFSPFTSQGFNTRRTLGPQSFER